MIKIYVLDTNVLLHEPQSLFSFQNNIVYIPTIVLEELDNNKNRNDVIGYNARETIRNLETIRINDGLNTAKPINEDGGTLYFYETPKHALGAKHDDQILAICCELMENNNKLILVTNDIQLRIKAHLQGVTAEEYITDQSVVPLNINQKVIKDERLYNALVENEYNIALEQAYLDNANYNIRPSEYFKLVNNDNDFLLCRRVIQNGTAFIVQVSEKLMCYGIVARNIEQALLMDSLLDTKINLVVCNGRAGSGKTLISLAAGLQNLEQHKYKKLLIYKTLIPFGEDIGYLKGDKVEKLQSWLQPFYDNLEQIFDTKGKIEYGYQYLFDKKLIEIDALTYIRGRSIPYRYIVIDEAQNLTPKQMKTIVSRIGENSKLILLGDIEQIDHPYLNAKNNGLAYVMCRMAHLSNVACFNLQKSERSSLATQAITYL